MAIIQTSPSGVPPVTTESVLALLTGAITPVQLVGYDIGEAELLGSLAASSIFAGSSTANLRDENPATYWSGGVTGAEWVGIDAGSVVEFSRISYMPTNGDGSFDFEIAPYGSTIEVASNSDYSDAVVVATITGFPHAPRFQWTDVSFTPTSGRYCRIKGASGAAFRTLAGLRFFAKNGSSAASKPSRPVITPAAGRFPGRYATVEITSATTAALIYYTTNGDTPTTASTLYKGPFEYFVPFDGSGEIKAIAHDATLSTPESAVTSSVEYTVDALASNQDWYDSRGILLENHSGQIYDDLGGSGYYYWIAGYANTAQKSGINDVFNTRGIFCYRSKDLLTWEFVSQLLPLSNNATGHVRPHILFSKATGKYVMWAREYVIAGDPGGIAIAESDQLTSGWAWVNHAYRIADESGFAARIYDYYLFMDGEDGYISYADGAGGGQVYCRKLASDFKSLTGTKVTITATGAREAPVVWKRGDYWFCVHSLFNYYGSAGAFDLKYSVAASPLGTWTGSTVLFPDDPLGTNFEGQSAFILNVAGKWILGVDQWVVGSLYASRRVMIPIVYPTPGKIRGLRLANWAPNETLPELGYDDFNRANGAIGRLKTGEAWGVSASAAWAIESNAARRSSDSTGIDRCLVDFAAADVSIQLRVSALGATETAGILLRQIDATRFWRFVAFSGECYLQKIDGSLGSPTTVLGPVGTIAAGGTLRVDAVGSAIRIYSNNVLVGSATDSFAASSVIHGITMAGTTTTSRMDRFEIKPLHVLED